MIGFRGGLNPSHLRSREEPALPPDGGGVFARETATLGAGPHTVRLQVQLPPSPENQIVSVTARRAGDADGEVLARAALDASAPDAAEAADALTLSFSLTEPGEVVFEGETTRDAARTFLRYLTEVPVESYEGAEDLFAFHRDLDALDLTPQSIVFGTTAVCNANCFHCPTNKAYSKTQAKGFMAPALFESVLTQLAGIGFKGGITFGLFGEPLQDPHILDRMRMIRRLLPDSIVVPSTNAGVYDPDKHAEALALADDVAVHIEGVSAAVYDASMRPLKAARTYPRAERLLADRAGKPVHVVTPVHGRNLAEAAELKIHWESRGAGPTVFTPLMNRAGQSPAFDDIAVAPQATACGPEVLRDLHIDWDGTVLACCQDFHRRSVIGDLKTQSLREILDGAERRRRAQLLNAKRWNAVDICAGCRNDRQESVDALIEEQVKEGDAERFFQPTEFRAKGATVFEDDVWKANGRRAPADRLLRPLAPAAQAVVFGPYKPLYPGTYRIRFQLARVRSELGGRLNCEVADPDARLTVRRLKAPRGDLAVEMEVEVGRYVPLEFRLKGRGVSFAFEGVSAIRTAL